MLQPEIEDVVVSGGDTYMLPHRRVRCIGEMQLRTRIADTVEIERYVRGTTAGFNTPTFVVDAPGGGGKRDVHSYDHYDETTGIGVYRSPSVDERRVYLYFDPIDRLPDEGRDRWEDEDEHRPMVAEALSEAGLEELEPAASISDALIPV